jgi:hypothetical protein
MEREGGLSEDYNYQYREAYESKSIGQNNMQEL